MFSSNLKRSVATLGVLAGLLAAAVPASADTLNGSGGGDRFNLDTGTAERLDMNARTPTKAKPASTQLGAADDISTPVVDPIYSSAGVR